MEIVFRVTNIQDREFSEVRKEVQIQRSKHDHRIKTLKPPTWSPAEE